MNKEISKKEFLMAEQKMNDLLDIATKKGGFDSLTKKETMKLDKYTQLVRSYENQALKIA